MKSNNNDSDLNLVIQELESFLESFHQKLQEVSEVEYNYRKEKGYGAEYPVFDEPEVKLAKLQKFDEISGEYKKLSDETKSTINQHLNEKAPEIDINRPVTSKSSPNKGGRAYLSDAKGGGVYENTRGDRKLAGEGITKLNKSQTPKELPEIINFVIHGADGLNPYCLHSAGYDMQKIASSLEEKARDLKKIHEITKTHGFSDVRESLKTNTDDDIADGTNITSSRNNNKRYSQERLI